MAGERQAITFERLLTEPVRNGIYKWIYPDATDSLELRFLSSIASLQVSHRLRSLTICRSYFDSSSQWHLIHFPSLLLPRISVQMRVVIIVQARHGAAHGCTKPQHK